MPEVLNHPMPDEKSISPNNGYRFDEKDWPRLSQNWNAYVDISSQAKGETTLKLWGCDVLTHRDDERTRSFLTNICKIADMDITNFVSSSQELENWFRSHSRGYIDEKLTLKKVAHSWDLLLRLRLICDVAIIMWANSPNNPPAKHDKIDCISDFLGDTQAVSALEIGAGARAFLTILNEAANRIKHPSGLTDWIRPDADGEILIFRKKIQHPIAQPVRDLVLGTNCFLVTLLENIKVKPHRAS